MSVIAQANSLQIGTLQIQKRDTAQRFKPPSSTIFPGAKRKLLHAPAASGHQPQPQIGYPRAYCESTLHYLTNYRSLKELSTDKVMQWLREKNRCWKCGRTHKAAECTLRKPCPKCNGQNLRILHGINIGP